MTDNWEDDKELMSTNRFYRFEEGENSVTIHSDGEKVRGQYGLQVEFDVNEDQILSLKPGPVLQALGEAKKNLGTLVGRTLKVVRVGTTKDDTRYSGIEVV